MDGWMDGLMGGWMDGLMDEWMDVWMDRWIQALSFCVINSSISRNL